MNRSEKLLNKRKDFVQQFVGRSNSTTKAVHELSNFILFKSESTIYTILQE